MLYPRLSQLLLFLAFLNLSSPVLASTNVSSADTYDYIVVGSGPGGGVVASNLALAGYTVMLIEAGSDASDDLTTVVDALQYPQHDDLQWSFFVKHHSDPELELRYRLLTWTLPDGEYWVGSADKAPKDAVLNGVWYPRGVTLGGSAIVNAMASVLPNDADWDHIASLTGDASWSAEKMRQVFVRVENNHYLSGNDSRLGHGFHGFMDIGLGNSSYYKQAPGRLALLGHLAESLVGHPLDEATVLDYLDRDVNYDGRSRDYAAKPFGLPDHNNLGRRWSPRDLILKTVNSTGGRLKLQLETLAAKVLFDNSTGGSPKASGVEFLEGKGVYGATWKYDAATAPRGTPGRAWARKEVILSGGAFNSPQLLQLSGIGNATHLRSLGIEVVADLPGVGLNLRDNQEIPVAGLSPLNITTTLEDPLWANCTYGAPDDPCLALWEVGQGPYAEPSGNSECAFLTTNSSTNGIRDVITFAPPGVFRGFAPPTNQTDVGLFTDLPTTLWRSIAHTNVQSNAGHVRLASADPRAPPDINIRGYEAPGGAGDADLAAVVDAVAWVRRGLASLPAPYGPVADVVEPPCPAGWDRASGYCADPEQDRRWVREQTFGHHPVGTCKIGPADDELAVVDSRFRVHGVRGLRVVDASVFPISPGGFPVLPTVMVGQKGSDVILEDA